MVWFEIIIDCVRPADRRFSVHRYMKMDPQTFETDNGHQINWDGNVWSI
jgi:hypothetical protein